jgi:hypothetical protein
MNQNEIIDLTYETVDKLLKTLGSDDTQIQLIKKLEDKCFFFGFDGFIDTINEVVANRITNTQYQKMESMKQWAQRIMDSAGSSGNMERVIIKQIAGGLTGNVPKALYSLLSSMFGMISKYNTKKSPVVNCIGTFGTHEHPESINEIFQKDLKINEKSAIKPLNLISIDEPGETQAFEFNDGKIMMTFFEPTNRINWERILKYVGKEKLINFITKSDIFSVGYWSSTPSMGDIYKELIKNVFPLFKEQGKRKKFILDFGDLRKKTIEQIKGVLQLVKNMNEFVDITITVNHTEANAIMKAISNENPSDIQDSAVLCKFANIIYAYCKTKRVIIHSPKYAAISSEIGNYIIKQAYTSKPKYSTSAGDHFNAGLAFGFASELDEQTSVLMGNLTSAAFIRLGYSPSISETLIIARKYSEYITKDIDSI